MPVATGAAPEMKALMAKMAELQSSMLQDSEWVGRRFADEARAIHHGETEHRTIHGQATAGEAAAQWSERKRGAGGDPSRSDGLRALNTNEQTHRRTDSLGVSRP